MPTTVEFDTAYKHPFSMVVSGTSGTGKTWFTMKVLQNATKPSIDKVYWFYGEWQDAYVNAPSNFTFVPGLPKKLDDYLDETSTGNKAVVFDDLMNQAAGSLMVGETFTQKRHHYNLSVVFITQNTYVQGKQMRKIHMNTMYNVFFSNPRDTQQFARIVSQVEYRSGHCKELVKAYREATSEPHGHLLIDFHPDTPEILRYRSRTLDTVQFVYALSK